MNSGAFSDPMLWRKVHNLWISEIYQELKPQVAGRLSLAIDQEVTLIDPSADPMRIRPDVRVTAIGKPVTAARPAVAGGAVAYAEGVESLSAESRHFITVQDLTGARVIGVIEVLSPTNKGHYSPAEPESFARRRHRLLAADLSYAEIDAVPFGTRWLPRSLESLRAHSGVIWTSVPRDDARLYRGWAWPLGETAPRVDCDLGEHGSVALDLDTTLREALKAAGVAPD